MHRGTLKDIALEGKIIALQSKIASLESIVLCLKNALTSLSSPTVTETDPTVPTVVKQITEGDIENWNTSFGWDNHADAGYLKEVDWSLGIPTYDDRYTLASTSSLDNSVIVQATFTAGEALGGHRVVMIDSDTAIYFDPSDEENAGRVLGLTSSAASLGESVNVVSMGKLNNPGWSLTPGTVYYASSTGNITSTPPSTGISIRVGVAVDSDTLDVHISEPYILI